jgi:hypothetical protein
MKINDLVGVEKRRKDALDKIKTMRLEIKNVAKNKLPNVDIIQIKPVGSVTDKKLFQYDDKVDVGIYVKSDQYKSGMSKGLTSKLKNTYDDMNLIVFVIEENLILNELKKVGYVNDYEGKQIIIAPDGYVFVFDDDNADEIDQILIDRYNSDIETIQEETEDGYHNFIMGIIMKNKLYIAEITESDLTSVLSSSIKKVIKEFNLDGLGYESEYSEFSVEHEISRDDVLDATFKTFEMYHGTNSNFIMKILSKGLMPTKHTNFDKVIHKDKVFFTSKYQYSTFHALNSAKRNNTIPIIIKFKIPDETKIVLDYDVAINLYGIDHPLTKKLGYDLVYKSATGGKTTFAKKDKSKLETWKKLADKASLNTRAGIFGYTGRIPPTFITGVYVDPDAIPLIARQFEYGNISDDAYDHDETEFVFMSVDKFKKLLQEAIDELNEFNEED